MRGKDSSISCDFLLVERPIFYLVEDLDEYLAGRGVVLDDFPFLAPGPHIRTPGALVSAVERWLREPEMYREEREALQRVMHTAEPPFREALLRAVREASL